MATQNPFVELFKPLATTFNTGKAATTGSSMFSKYRPAKPANPFNLGTSSQPNMSVLPPNASTPTGPKYFPPAAGFSVQPSPQVKAPAAAPATPAKPAIPAVPAAPAAAAGAPIPPQTPQAPQGEAKAPETPQISPEVTRAVELAEKAYEKSLQISPDELSTQEDLDKLIESTKKAYLNTEGQAIPMEFITGQLSAIERRAVNLAEPLERKLARLQAARQSSVEGSKFALERADKALTSERTRVRETITDAESRRRFDVEEAGREEARTLQKKQFEEDKRQFGLNYALSQQKTKQEADEKRKTADAAASETLDNYSLVNELLGSNTNAIAGVRGVTSFLPGTKAQYAKNLAKQLNGVLALDNRQKLKGSGAISDFEARTLAQAASALGINQESGTSNLSNADFQKELRKVRGAFANAAGLSASVKVVDPKTGKVDNGSLTREQIDSAISQGFTVEYQ